MNLIATTHGSAYNGVVPYQESVHSDHTILMPPLDVLAVAHLSGFRVPLYPPDLYPSDPTLDSAAYAYVSRYAAGGAEVSTVPGTKILDAGHVKIDGCTSVTFTGLVLQGAMSMIGMVFAD